VSYAEVAGFVKEGGRIVGARVVDRLGRGEVVARARVVVNAAGPWVDRVVALDAPETPPRLRLTKGVHVVVPHERVGNRAAVVLSAVADRRVMFVIPWGAHTLVGTTDTDHLGGPDVPPVVEPSDVAYLLDPVNHYLAGRYGSRLDEVLGLVARDQRLGEPIVAGLPDLRAEVVEAVEREWALTLEDVLRRRTQVALRDASAGAAAADDVAALMARPLGWDEE